MNGLWVDKLFKAEINAKDYIGQNCLVYLVCWGDIRNIDFSSIRFRTLLEK